MHRPLAPLILLVCVTTTTPAFAQKDWRKQAPSWATAEDIAAEKHLRGLCMFIDGRSRTEPGAGAYRYRAIQSIVSAAGVTGEVDTPEKTARVQALWKRFEQYLVCNNTQFDMANGSALKFAVASKFDDFIDFAAETRMGLNQVDQDGQTVLDYVVATRDRTAGTPIGQKMDVYYNRLRQAGALRRSELR